MRNKTVEKTSKAGAKKTFRGVGGTPSRKTNAEIGAITRGSSGRPKASPKGTDAGRTRVAKTTSTNFPEQPVPKNFVNKLGEMHRGETELSLSLPLVVAAAKAKDLKTLLKIHLKETRSHVKTLEQIAKSLGVELPSRSCRQMTQYIKEAVKVIGKRIVSGDKDQEIIAVGQKIERFEISSYEPLCAEAKEREYTHERALLTSILTQEQLAEELLGKLAAGKGPLGDLVMKASLKRAAGKG